MVLVILCLLYPLRMHEKHIGPRPDSEMEVWKELVRCLFVCVHMTLVK